MPRSQSTAGGALIAFGAVAGAAIGFAARQPTLGFLMGIVIGIALSLLIWWRER